jgi:hypothetical protein
MHTLLPQDRLAELSAIRGAPGDARYEAAQNQLHRHSVLFAHRTVDRIGAQAAKGDIAAMYDIRSAGESTERRDGNGAGKAYERCRVVYETGRATHTPAEFSRLWAAEVARRERRES